MPTLIVDEESEDEEDKSSELLRNREQIIVEVNSLNSLEPESFSYIRGKVSNKDVYTMILVDTGNTTQNNIISEEFFLLTELPLVEQEAMTLGTTDKQGGGLKVVGRVAELKLHFKGMKAPVYMQPWVVRGLSHPINLGMKFMQEHGANLQTNQCSNQFSINGESTRTIGVRGGMFPGQTVDKSFPQNSGHFQPAGKLIWIRKPQGRLMERGVPAV